MSPSRRDVGARRGLREGIQVDGHHLEGIDGSGRQLGAMVGTAQVGEDARLDGRVERLDASVEHLRRAGHGGHVGHRQATGAQRRGGAAGRDQLEPKLGEAVPELEEAALVGHRQQRPSRTRQGGGDVRVDDHAAIRDAQRAGRGQRDTARQELVLGRVQALGKGRLIVAGQHRDGPLRHDGSAVERLVHQVHA